jgi:hypothetical protein
MKRIIAPALCVMWIQGMNLWANGGKEASKDDYVIKVGIGISAGDYLKGEIYRVVEASSRVYKNHPAFL